MSKILVSGGCGFMASWIADSLVDKGHQVFSVDDLSGGTIDNIGKKVKFRLLDLREGLKVEKYIEKIRPSILFHLCANARECASFFQPREVTERNLMAYINVLEPCIKYGIKKIILFSSMARFGNQQVPFSEDLIPKPVDIYASNKVAMEEITKQLAGAHGFDWTIIVPRNVFGERQSLQDRMRNFLAITMNHIMRGEDVIIYGDGKQIRSFSYILNSLPCYIKCLDKKTNGEIINIGGLVPKTINEVAEIIISNFPDYKGKIKHLPSRYGEVKVAYGTYEKSVKLLGYEEKYSLEEGIRRMSYWAKRKGPQEWSKDQLTLINKKVPVTWR